MSTDGTITIRVPVLPIAQPRQRHHIMTRANGKAFVHNYTPSKGPAADFKATVRMAALEAYDGPQLDGPLRCDLTFVFKRPDNMRWKTKPMPREWHTKKPDIDNLSKAVMDALSGVLWSDDKQVCCGSFSKMIASGDEQPHVDIRITEL